MHAPRYIKKQLAYMFRDCEEYLAHPCNISHQMPVLPTTSQSILMGMVQRCAGALVLWPVPSRAPCVPQQSHCKACNMQTNKPKLFFFFFWSVIYKASRWDLAGGILHHLQQAPASQPASRPTIPAADSLSTFDFIPQQFL